MKTIPMGGNAALPSDRTSFSVICGAEIDVTVLQTYADGKVRSDGDMCFFNQPEISGGAVRLTNNGRRVEVSTGAIPAAVEKLVVTATMADEKATFGAAGSLRIEVGGEMTLDTPLSGRTEAALILCEIYRRNGEWKVRNVSQGFNGGLAALATHFGVEIAEDEAPAAPSVMERKMVSLEKRAPEMVSLVKQATVSLAKNVPSSRRAKLALVLDISGSMKTLYRSGKVDVLVRRVMAMGYAMDDDGDIDVFLFGKNVHDFGTVTVETYRSVVRDIMARYDLEAGTRYGDAIARIRAHYTRNNPEGLPVFVMFVTDGGTDDKPKTERELRAASHEPIFWKFMAIQEGSGRWDAQRFEFLDKLDNLTGRLIDNADAFSLSDPAAPSDAEMFELMMTEYEGWIKAALNAGVLRG